MLKIESYKGLVFLLVISIELLKALEDNNDGPEVCSAPLLGVTSYGVSMTTLEEVFLQLEDTSEETEESTSESEPSQVEIKAFNSHFYLVYQ